MRSPARFGMFVCDAAVAWRMPLGNPQHITVWSEVLAIRHIARLHLLVESEIQVDQPQAHHIPLPLMRHLLLLLLPFCLPASLAAQWLDPTGPTGGRITVLRSTLDGLYAGSSAGGVMRTTDGGEFWREVNHKDLVPKNVIAIATDDSVIYVANDGGVQAARLGDPDWRTDVRGFVGNSDLTILSLEFVGWGTFAGTASTLHRHLNGALSWELMRSTLVEPGDMVAAVPLGSRLVAGFRNDGILISLDSGQNWRQPALQLSSGNEVIGLAVVGSRIVAGTYEGVFISSDSGESWLPADGIPVRSTSRKPVLLGSVVLVSTINGFFRSDDGGVTWSPVASSGLPSGLQRIALEVHDNALYLSSGEGNGIFRSDDTAATWRAVNRGVTNTVIESLAVQGDMLLAAALEDGGFASDDGGTTWRRFGPGGTESVIRGFFVHGDTIISESSGSSSLTTDGGATWRQIPQESPVASTMTLHRGATIGANSRNLLRLNGTNWETVASVPVDKAVAMISIDGTIVLLNRNGAIYRSMDNGSTWSASQSQTELYRAYAIERLGDDLYIAGATNVFRSSDQGATWTQLPFAIFETAHIRDLLAVDDRLFIATDLGVYVTVDRGATFQNITDNMGSHYVLSLATIGGQLVAGTLGSGVTRRSLSTISSADSDLPADAPAVSVFQEGEGIRLRIHGGIASGAGVRLKISDLRGRLLVAEDLGFGSDGGIDRVFDPALASGLYIVEIVSGRYRASMLLPVVR